ncbi:universal stress protein [Natrialba sp. INN-245]|uniref:universal stress protein n=1 Tax=Natrialba sp. INN-245 TaxID=2690967 RepID=UPI0013122DD2|nr:universal stress protein [Natrialba sp. INN-245]MWV41854.1 universal stress protein [Natrialba sp. INN-245]
MHLAVERRPVTPPDQVLVPTLARPRESEALEYALETFPDADVTLLAVVTPLDAPLSEGGVLERDEQRTEVARERAESVLESTAESIDDRAAIDRVRVEVVAGRPGTVVPRYTDEEGVDHVVMYGHERRSTGLTRRLLGRGVAATVVERTASPVTVIR